MFVVVSNDITTLSGEDGQGVAQVYFKLGHKYRIHLEALACLKTTHLT